MFKLTEERLATAFNRARLEPRDAGAVLFGIRGCTPTGTGTHLMGPGHDLVTRTPDHLHPRCTLGVWKRGEGLAVFPGSTVPAEREVERALPRGGKGANQLCIGLHRGYKRGPHNLRNARFRHRALRMERYLPVQRTDDDLDFEGDDRLEYETAYDNIHCGWVPDVQASGFSSAGCQVVVGTANPEAGPWRDFVSLIYAGPQLEFDYALFTGGEIQRVCQAGPGELLMALRYGSAGDEVEAVQEALNARGYGAGRVDGDFGWNTLLAVYRFQRQAMGQAPDGIVGPQTLTALGLEGAVRPDRGEPLAALSQEDEPDDAVADAQKPVRGPRFAYRTEMSDAGKWRHHYAKEERSGSGSEFYLGYETRPKTSIFVGLCPSAKRLGPVGAHRYNPDDYAQHGAWAHFVVPTGMGESALWFERINTYDRAAFTYGFFQAAAHYPRENFILLFKDMLARPEGRDYFPDLVLRPSPNGPRLFQVTAEGEMDLEHAEPRSGASSEMNLKRFMAYLNPTLRGIEEQELAVAAKLMHWTREVRGCRDLQVDHAIRALRERMAHVRAALVGRPVDQCLLAADIRYQGRGGPGTIKKALSSARPMNELSEIGAQQHAARIGVVVTALKSLMKDPEIKRLRFDPASPNLFS